MTMGTNNHAQARSRSSKRGAAIYGFAGMMLALIAGMTFPSLDAWYMVAGYFLIAIMAVVYVAKAIVALRQDD
ncbi:hypothetical protein [Arthrobacter bussei]|uniref:Uncharacterized protein n=1 Tax=Arthrobacter bussei TaxID=2594179 RepID=A0A7X1NLQ7_9MICC|nr:hypothetical protein [Arthrobacter bussei]MPY09156.1 hypothetical protein [Arthrobacter bussei]